jgi:hypothetical protein
MEEEEWEKEIILQNTFLEKECGFHLLRNTIFFEIGSIHSFFFAISKLSLCF